MTFQRFGFDGAPAEYAKNIYIIFKPPGADDVSGSVGWVYHRGSMSEVVSGGGGAIDIRPLWEGGIECQHK
jgi:hypothetical protein